MPCGGHKIWYHCKFETKFMDCFTKSQTFSAQWPFTLLVTNSLQKKIIKIKLLLITNINHNLGDSVAKVIVSDPKVTFNINRIKYNNICKLLKKTPNERKLKYSKKQKL